MLLQGVSFLFLCITTFTVSTSIDISSSGGDYKKKGVDYKEFKTALDGTKVDRPAKNTIFFCQQVAVIGNVTISILPASFYTLRQQNSSWVKNGKILVDKIPTVPGSVTMKHEFSMKKTKNYRHLSGNGIPNHPIGVYPIVAGSTAYDIYSSLPAQGYPNAAAIPVYPYNLTVYLPLRPKFNKIPSCLAAQESLSIGISIQTGAPWHVEIAANALFQGVDPSDALPTDACWGHPYYGQYHYHGYSWKCFPNQGTEGVHSPLFGYAMDGFGIYGPRSLGGRLVKNEDLDECHGHTHELLWDDEVVSIYHYHLNNEYPYSVGCYRGTPQYFGNSPDSLTNTCGGTGAASVNEAALNHAYTHDEKINLFESLAGKQDFTALQERILMGNHAPYL